MVVAIEYCRYAIVVYNLPELAHAVSTALVVVLVCRLKGWIMYKNELTFGSAVG